MRNQIGKNVGHGAGQVRTRRGGRLKLILQKRYSVKMGMREKDG